MIRMNVDDNDNDNNNNNDDDIMIIMIMIIIIVIIITVTNKKINQSINSQCLVTLYWASKLSRSRYQMLRSA